jgi:hypothetical protein
MTHLTTRLAFRALFAIVMQTEVHAETKLPTPWVCMENICKPLSSVPSTIAWDCTDDLVCTERQIPPTCAPDYDQTCQQRDHGASPYQGRGR